MEPTNNHTLAPPARSSIGQRAISTLYNAYSYLSFFAGRDANPEITQLRGRVKNAATSEEKEALLTEIKKLAETHLTERDTALINAYIQQIADPSSKPKEEARQSFAHFFSWKSSPSAEERIEALLKRVHCSGPPYLEGVLEVHLIVNGSERSIRELSDLPPWLKNLIIEHPEVMIDLHQTMTEEASKRLRKQLVYGEVARIISVDLQRHEVGFTDTISFYDPADPYNSCETQDVTRRIYYNGKEEGLPTVIDTFGKISPAQQLNFNESYKKMLQNECKENDPYISPNPILSKIRAQTITDANRTLFFINGETPRDSPVFKEVSDPRERAALQLHVFLSKALGDDESSFRLMRLLNQAVMGAMTTPLTSASAISHCYGTKPHFIPRGAQYFDLFVEGEQAVLTLVCEFKVFDESMERVLIDRFRCKAEVKIPLNDLKNDCVENFEVCVELPCLPPKSNTEHVLGLMQQAHSLPHLYQLTVPTKVQFEKKSPVDLSDFTEDVDTHLQNLLNGQHRLMEDAKRELLAYEENKDLVCYEIARLIEIDKYRVYYSRAGALRVTATDTFHLVDKKDLGKIPAVKKMRRTIDYHPEFLDTTLSVKDEFLSPDSMEVTQSTKIEGVRSAAVKNNRPFQIGAITVPSETEKDICRTPYLVNGKLFVNNEERDAAVKDLFDELKTELDSEKQAYHLLRLLFQGTIEPFFAPFQKSRFFEEALVVEQVTLDCDKIFQVEMAGEEIKIILHLQIFAKDFARQMEHSDSAPVIGIIESRHIMQLSKSDLSDGTNFDSLTISEEIGPFISKLRIN